MTTPKNRKTDSENWTVSMRVKGGSKIRLIQFNTRDAAMAYYLDPPFGVITLAIYEKVRA